MREWPLDVDPEEIRGLREKPTPFRHFVVKLHARCNLSCSYCYLYTKGDETWKDASRKVSEHTLRATAQRIAEHVQQHLLTSIEVIFHGGEPLLAGPAAIDQAAAIIRAAVPLSCAIGFTVQTNGLLLDDDFLAVLHRHGIRAGVSLDGGAQANDAHRVYADGRGSYSDVTRSLRLLGTESHRELFAGILATIDVSTDPVETYQSLLEFTPPIVDFLLPHGNWTTPPPGRVPGKNAAPYGRWLARVFDRYYSAPVAETRVRLFDAIVEGLLGGDSTVEVIGLSPVGVIVVSTDGDLEQVDTLRASYHGASAVGLNVFAHSMDDALDHPGVIARQIGVRALHDDCRRCHLLRVCGGGFYGHRFRRGDGYKNPSVFCPDLMYLIEHVDARLARDVRDLVMVNS